MLKTLFSGVFFFVFVGKNLVAQQVFVPNGRITFEKRVNMQRNAADWNLPDEAREQMKKYRTSEWELYFDQTRSLYKVKKKEAENDNPLLFLSLNEPDNELFANYGNQNRVIKKSIMGEDYLFKDTIPSIDWKVMHDLRTIAGYECRKAIGIINDTVYVVAFYSEEILLRGGPEGFSGLPGMILGLAIPRLNTTWFANRVDGFVNHAEPILPPAKGKKMETDKDLLKLLEIYGRYEGGKKDKPEVLKSRLFGFLL